MTTDAVAGARERPILFSGEMVRAILDGRKSQTRRVVKFRHGRHIAGNPENDGSFEWWPVDRGDGVIIKESRAVLLGECPYGRPGDRLYVRETWSMSGNGPFYRADTMQPETVKYAWKPSIHMPRWASRLTLEITEVRVERLQDISAEDAEAEGLTKRGYWWDVGANWEGDGMADDPIEAYRCLWDKLNAKRGYGWDVNPWVWVLAFRVASPRTGEGKP